jgi:hypothetical protein
MYSRVYTLRFRTLDQAKIGVSLLSEEIGGAIAEANIASLSILIDKGATVTLIIRFDRQEELDAFVKSRIDVLQRLKTAFELMEYSESTAVAVYLFDREAGSLS